MNVYIGVEVILIVKTCTLFHIFMFIYKSRNLNTVEISLIMRGEMKCSRLGKTDRNTLYLIIINLVNRILRRCERN